MLFRESYTPFERSHCIYWVDLFRGLTLYDLTFRSLETCHVLSAAIFHSMWSYRTHVTRFVSDYSKKSRSRKRCVQVWAHCRRQVDIHWLRISVRTMRHHVQFMILKNCIFAATNPLKCLRCSVDGIESQIQACRSRLDNLSIAYDDQWRAAPAIYRRSRPTSPAAVSSPKYSTLRFHLSIHPTCFPHSS